jgi:hypothetical protein
MEFKLTSFVRAWQWGIGDNGEPVERQGPRISATPEEMLRCIKEHYENNPELTPGYVESCVLLFPRNTTSEKLEQVQITPENKHLIESGYISRTKDAPMLDRWLPCPYEERQDASYLCVICYKDGHYIEEEMVYLNEQIEDPSTSIETKESLLAEVQKLKEKKPDPNKLHIVMVKPQDVDVEIEMDPQAMIRNQLGKKFFHGSGVPVDQETYLRSVERANKYVKYHD